MGLIVNNFVYKHFSSSVLQKCQHMKPRIPISLCLIKLFLSFFFVMLVENIWFKKQLFSFISQTTKN